MLEQSIVIAASPATVWRLWTQPEGLRQWWGAAEVTPEPGGRFRIAVGADRVPAAGSAGEQEGPNAPEWYVNIDSMQWRGEPRVAAGALVAFTARFLGRALTWSATEDGSTRMTLRNRGEPSGFASVAAPMTAAAMRGANRKDLDQLRVILETETETETETEAEAEADKDAPQPQ